MGGDATIRAGDHANLRPGKRGHHAAQIIRRDIDITVIDKNVAVLRRAQHLHQITGLAIVAQHFRADQKADFTFGKFPNQPLDGFHGGIVRLTYAENDFIFRITLYTVAAETFIHLRINAAQWLEDGYRRSKGRQLPAARSEESPGAP